MPEILRLEINVPVEIALQCESGIMVAGRYGDRVMFSLTDQRRIYVAPYVAKRIDELGIQAGELFQICKRQVLDGRRKTIHWLVERVEAGSESQLERDLRESIERAKATNTSDSEPMASLVSPVQLPGRAIAECQRRNWPRRSRQRFAAAAEAERFAKVLDYNIRFTTEDVRSMGITILIGMQQRAPR